MKQEILTNLDRKLHSKGLDLVYAAEAGSRAWGFASIDSDYDVRFIFKKSRDAYLSLEAGVEDLQWTDGLLDFSGWDLRKALRLAHKSNPTFIEWLHSPIVYWGSGGEFQKDLLELFKEHYSPKALAHHYINFMRNTRGKYLSDFTGEFSLKRYLYALRPIFVITWMGKNPGLIPPVDFPTLAKTECPKALCPDLERLLALKASGTEKGTEKFEVFNSLISHWFNTGHGYVDKFPSKVFPIEPLDKLFRKTLNSL